MDGPSLGVMREGVRRGNPGLERCYRMVESDGESQKAKFDELRVSKAERESEAARSSIPRGCTVLFARRTRQQGWVRQSREGSERTQCEGPR